MNIVMGILVMSVGAFLVIRNRDLVTRAMKGSAFFHDVETSTSRENLLIIGAMMLLGGLAFLML